MRIHYMRLPHIENPLYKAVPYYVRASIRICAPLLMFVGLRLLQYNKAYAVGFNVSLRLMKFFYERINYRHV